jgi:rubrerythrin
MFFLSIAKKQGYGQISSIFLETAENERERAKRFLKDLKGGSPSLKIEVEILTNTVCSTLENLKFAAAGEQAESTSACPQFASQAEEEGFAEIAATFRSIAEVEAAHQRRHELLARQIETGTIFKREREVVWKCRNGGYILTGIEAPTKGSRAFTSRRPTRSRKLLSKRARRFTVVRLREPAEECQRFVRSNSGPTRV